MISVTILTKDSQRLLKEVLASLSSFDEVILYDTGSKDTTLAIAKEFKNVTIHEGPFLGFGKTHNMASSLAEHDWILSIDSDEIVTEELRKEIFSLILDPSCIYSFPRDNFYSGKHIKGCGWYPDRVLRLYNRNKTHFQDMLVHESLQTEGMKVIPLSSPVLHTPYDSVSSFLKKMNSYSDLYSEQYKGKKKASFASCLLHTFFTFFKSYFLQKGFLLGREGFEIAFFNMNCTFYKYLKLIEKNSIH
jgi:glycosyltransferase involved in cell wall biosynthesis